MAPAIVRRAPSGEQIRQFARTVSTTLSSLSSRAADVSEPPLVSIFALVISRTSTISKRTAPVISESLQSSPEIGIATAPLSLAKRQDAILAIPTIYQGLNAGPAPGAVVGIILGSVAGFILCLYILLLSFQFVGGRNKTVVEEEVIVHRRNRSRSRSRHTVMTERNPSPPPSPPRPPPPRQSSRRETIVIEERVHVPSRAPSRVPSRPPPREPTPELDEVIVEEEESMTEEMVEVIEEESSISASPPRPSPPPSKPSPRRESRRSGYRTVDPAEFGGGDAPLRRIKKR